MPHHLYQIGLIKAVQLLAMPTRARFTLASLLILGGIASAYALRHSSILQHAAVNAAATNPSMKLIEAKTQRDNPLPLPIENLPETNSSKSGGGRATVNEILAQIIANAIDSGRLNSAALTAEQIALLPQWLKDKIAAANSRRLADEGKRSAEDETEQPEAPQKFPCPEPGKLPPDWDNEYNKIFLRQQGCQL